MTDEHDLPPRGVDEDEEKTEGESERKPFLERTIPEVFKRVVERAVETGVGKLAEGPENLRQFVSEMKLPKEVLHYIYQQMDDTKNGLYRVVAKEIRDVLESMQLADEITKVLTRLSFEIKTEIRFIPNDAAVQGSSKGSGGGEGEAEGHVGLPKPDVSTHISVKDRSKDARPGRRGREDT